MKTVDSSERKLFLENQVRSLRLKHIESFICAKALRDRVCGSRKADPVLKHVGFSTFHQLVVVLLGDGEERILHITNLADAKPSLFTLIPSRNKTKHQDLLAVQIFVDWSLDDIFVLLFASSNVRSVRGGARTPRTVVVFGNDSHCMSVPGIATTGENVAQKF